MNVKSAAFCHLGGPRAQPAEVNSARTCPSRTARVSRCPPKFQALTMQPQRGTISKGLNPPKRARFSHPPLQTSPSVVCRLAFKVNPTPTILNCPLASGVLQRAFRSKPPMNDPRMQRTKRAFHRALRTHLHRHPHPNLLSLQTTCKHLSKTLVEQRPPMIHIKGLNRRRRRSQNPRFHRFHWRIYPLFPNHLHLSRQNSRRSRFG